MGHKCNILAQSQGIFYMHQASIVVDYCTKYEHTINPFISEISQQIKWMKIFAINW